MRYKGVRGLKGWVSTTSKLTLLSLLLIGACLEVVSHREDDLPGWKGEKSRRNEVEEDEDPAGGNFQQECSPVEHTEYWGSVVKWGENNYQESAALCCEDCSLHAQQATQPGAPTCNTWVWCGAKEGCGGQRRFGECWLKHQDDPSNPLKQSEGDGTKWTSGVMLSMEQAHAKQLREQEEQEERLKRRTDKSNPRVFFDIEINGKSVGRIEFVLYMDTSPLAAENFRSLCTGERGTVPIGHEGAGRPYHFQGKNFYRIIDQFINQAGAGTDSVYGGMFKDDPGGLKLLHDRPGLLSMANMGPDTNTSHFSIMVNAAPHLNGKYTIFGEVVAGMDVVTAINKLANKAKDTYPHGRAVIVKSGQLA